MTVGSKIDAATAAELERLELQLLDPAVRRDADRVAALPADDFFEFGTSRRVWTGARPIFTLRSSIWTNKSGPWRIRIHPGTRRN